MKEKETEDKEKVTEKKKKETEGKKTEKQKRQRKKRKKKLKRWNEKLAITLNHCKKQLLCLVLYPATILYYQIKKFKKVSSQSSLHFFLSFFTAVCIYFINPITGRGGGAPFF